MAETRSIRKFDFDIADSETHYNDTFDDFIELYLTQLENDRDADEEERRLLAILSSASSSAALGILRNANALRLANVKTQVIFGCLSPIASVAAWLDPRSNFMIHVPADHFRWVKNRSLLDAHEQIVLGRSMSWSGDSMRRRANRRDSFELFEDRSPAMARLGRLAFESMWEACAELPWSKIKTVEKVLSGCDVNFDGQAREDNEYVPVPAISMLH